MLSTRISKTISRLPAYTPSVVHSSFKESECNIHFIRSCLIYIKHKKNKTYFVKIICFFFRQMKCNSLKHRYVLREIIQHKCSTIFEEAQNTANDFKILDRYKDLFIEQSKILD